MLTPNPRTFLARLAASALAVAAAGLLVPGTLAAQADTVTVVAGPQYSAEGIKATVLGEDYRDLWTTPIRVPVLDPDTFAGGLTVTERGGGKQTLSLRLLGADGREYVFRSVDKDQTGGLPADFKETLIDRIFQDQVSSKHPGAALVVAPLLEAAEILHATPRFFVLPDDPDFLGEHREEFAGMLGMVEERAEENREAPPLGFPGAIRVAGTPRLFEHLEEDPAHRVADREYLAARLMDFLVGDWDRHPDQWRWARYDRGDLHVWMPVPRDRDNAFSRYDGLMMDMVRSGAPLLVEFEETYPSIYGLTQNAQLTDRSLLAEVPAAVFDSVAISLQQRLTDAVIDDAVTRVPPPYRELRSAELARILKARRDALPAVAREFYGLLAQAVDVQATDQPELAEVTRAADGSVLVQLSTRAGADGARAPAPYFERRFLPSETDEVRIFLRGGDDRAVVRGAGGEGVLVRLIGGGGDDVLADSVAGDARAVFYDSRGENELIAGSGTRVDRREYERPDTLEFGAQPPRDWGSTLSWLSPHAEWRSNIGPVLGAGPMWTRYGFRKEPHASQVAVRLLYAPLRTRFGVEAEGEFRRENSTSRFGFLARATQLAVTRFHGYGNETVNSAADSDYKVWETQYLLAPAWVLGLSEELALFAGPVAKYTNPEVEFGSPADLFRPIGSEAFGQLGGQVGVGLDTRDFPAYPRRGLHLSAAATAFPAVWDVPGAFGAVEGSVATFLPVAFRESVLALRVGGRTAWGDFPIQEAAYVGGSGTVRGYPRQRFLGESAAFANAEARTFLTRFNFISRGDLGTIALFDVGRVYADGETSDVWHTAVGGGVWIGILERTRTASLIYAYGEEHSLSLSFGMPF